MARRGGKDVKGGGGSRNTGHTRSSRPVGSVRAGATVAVLACVALLAGCGGQRADGSHNAAVSDGKGSAGRQQRTDPSAPPSPLPQETSTPDPHQPPPLVSMDIAHAAEGGGKGVNITVDDGPDPVWTPRILKILKKNGVKATFCMIGPQAAAHPDLVKKVLAGGHRLCDHTVTHNTAMDHRSQSYQKDQILKAAHQIEQASGGVKPMYYRAPGGAFTPYSRQLAAHAGMRPLGWNVDSKDFERPGVPTILATVQGELSNGPTVLFHDGGGDRSQTAAALKKLLPWLRQHGYSFSFPVR
ncbi:polysaccharide deacetylase family protein [Streptomyces sp. 150FB]|uniref:polysaccharide deacetylase family protein n=1 Tax=Streptomyces sp. 150FB TaxID=1576605 RepID=UPI00099B7A27|nr:polysaccharide deacetylase family protein [Streptomyces sp. 150FB]